MIRLPEFRLVEPASLEEALGVLADAGPRAAVVAGGTGLFPNMKRRTTAPELIVSLGRIPGLATLERRPDGSAWIGSSVTLELLARDRSWVPGQAAAEVGSPQIRAMATLGGNLCVETRCNFYDMTEEWREAVGWCLKAGGDTCQVAPKGDKCWAVVSSDLAPVMVALEAVFHVAAPAGTREVAAGDFYADDGLRHITLQSGEILIGVEIPPVDRAGYRKVRRRGAIDFPILGVAAALHGTAPVARARIVLGAVSPRPMRALAAEKALEGRELTPEAITEAGELTAKIARPLDNTDLTPRYRRRMVAVTTSRLLADLADANAS